MLSHCTALAAAALLVTAAPAFAQTAAAAPPAPGGSAFSIFLRGAQIGREQATVARTDSGWIITSTGQSGPPLDFTINRFEVKYGPDWQPLEMTLEARARTVGLVIRSSFTMTTAINEITQGNNTVAKNDQISARTIVMPNNVFASYEVLAARLWDAPVDAEIPVYVVPSGEVTIKVRRVSDEKLAGPAGTVATRRFDLLLMNRDRPVNATALVDDRRRLVRFEIPEVGLQAVRDDVSSVAVRAETGRNPTDADVSIPADGFNLAGTLTTPQTVAGRLRYPAVLLVGGTSPADRDQVIEGTPVFAQLARALAAGNHVVLRYDRRGTGQSGGRTDTATLADYVEDAIAAVRWLARRDDVDKKRVVVVGHLDGGPVALLAAAARKEIDGVATIDAAGATGAELILLQQQRVLEEMKLPATDRQARIELQKKIQAAVVSGSGWAGVPEPLRRQADTPWFRSVLTYDPANVLPKIRQPLLVIHGDLDPTVPAAEADRLAALGKARKKAQTEVVHLPDVSYTLTPAGATQVSTKATDAIAAWIKKL